MVEHRGLEPLTPTLPVWCAPSCANAPLICINKRVKKHSLCECLLNFGGRGWIRTIEAKTQQIYSLPPLAAREHSHMFPRSIECLSIIARRQRKCKSFFDFYATFFRRQIHGRCVQKFVTPQMPFCGIITK